MNLFNFKKQKDIRENLTQAFTLLCDVRKMHNLLDDRMKRVLSNLFYYVKFQDYPEYFFIKEGSFAYFEAGQLNAVFNFS